MTILNYKPLTVNRAWQGRRFKTAEYTRYEADLLLMLPKLKMPDPPFKIDVEFGMSALSDLDNPLKPLLDVLQKKYGINDRDILELRAKKKVVKKGKEFIAFKIETSH